MSSRRYLPLEEYGLVGDGRSAALVGRNGSVDWWCPPRFDAPSVFGGLLDDRIGGFCSLAPAGAIHASPLWESSQRYRPGTAVLVTEFRGADARLAVTDAMPWPGPDPEADPGDPPTLIRRVEARGGPVEAELRFAPRFDYARRRPEYREGETGWTAAGTQDEVITLSAGPALDLDVDGRRDEVSGRFRVEPGDPRWVVLRWGEREPGAVSAETARRALERTERRWRRRAERVPFPRPEAAGEEADSFARRARESVVRSALVLDLLTHVPTGGVVGAPTAWLPGAGPSRDGRRLPGSPADATAVVAALEALGREREARRLCRRLADAGPGGRLRGDGSAARDARGGSRSDGTEVDHLHGYEGRPPAPAVPDAGPAEGAPRLLARDFEEARELALGGRPGEAARTFAAAAGRAGPTGLLAEARDPESGRLRGNLPSAAAHAALVNAARVIAAAGRGAAAGGGRQNDQ